MHKYSKVYFIASSINENSESLEPIDLQIFLGEGHRQWYEPHYFDKSINPIGKIKTMVPEGPNDQNSLIDACIVFAPKYFESCPSLEKIKLEFKNKTRLDFDSNEDIPESWDQLRREAAPIFEKLNIFKIKLIPLTVDQKYLHLNYKEQ